MLTVLYLIDCIKTQNLEIHFYFYFKIAKESAPEHNPRKFSMGPAALALSQEAHRVKRECYWHFTTATSTQNIQTVFEDVHHMIINQHLETLGLA